MQEFDKYIKIVDNVLDLSKNKDSSIQLIENTKKFYYRNKEQFKNIVPEYTTGKISCGIFVAYGIKLYAATIGKKVELLTHQDGYNDTPIFSFRVDDILDYSSEHIFWGENNKIDTYEEKEENEFLKASSILLNWSINPQSNIDILPEIISKIVVPSIKRIRKSIVGIRPVINVLLPPFAKDFTSFGNYEGEESNTFDITQIFQGTDLEDMEINFLDYSSLVNIKGYERKYLAIHHSDGTNNYLVISVFENIRGHKECLGHVAINICTQESFILQTFKQEYRIEKKETLLLNKKKEKNVIHFNLVKNKLPILSSCSSFLSNHTTSFIDNEFILKAGIKTDDKELNKIISFFSNIKSMSVAEICSLYISESNLYNIALSDMVYIAVLLDQHTELFQQSTLKLNRKDRIVSVPNPNNDFIHFMSNLLPHLPSNFGRITWKINFIRPWKIIPYKSIDYKSSLHSIVESVIKHYDDCTTDDVIEEYLFIKTKNKKQGVNEVPNAISTAKMFIEMINITSIKIDSCNNNNI